MEMLSSLRGDMHEFCLVAINFKHVRCCPSFDITKYMTAKSEEALIFHQGEQTSVVYDSV